jgi:ATP-binding cassette, subfamily A (ABC1), member 3
MVRTTNATGVIGPTAGYATIGGKDIRTEMSAIRQDIGICLQHDCLFPHLTAREHIQFFARIKGLYGQLARAEAEKQIDQSLVDVALSEKRDTFSKNLSGGMKRKLSLAIAFCGGSKIVMLDEPTSGQDPFSRRFTWNVIRNYKKDRIIILTTHFMDEADILGDRIAIMAEGQLRCVGSSLFLKKAYGVGYQLTIEKGQQNNSRRLNADNVPSVDIPAIAHAALSKKLKQIVTGAVPEASLVSEVGSEMSFQLPLSAAPAFPPMLSDLDEQVDTGSINCYGVSITTLNEVFHLVTRGETPVGVAAKRIETVDSDAICVAATSEDTNDSDADEASNFGRFLDSSKQDGLCEDEQLFTRHVVALLKKRASYFRRDKKAWICTTIVPSLFVLVGFLVFVYTAPGNNMTPLILSLRDYNPDLPSSIIPFNSPDNPFLCQPGLCSHNPTRPVNTEEMTNETYVFCGYESKLGVTPQKVEFSNATCSVADTTNVTSGIAPGIADPFAAPVGNVTQVRRSCSVSSHCSILSDTRLFRVLRISLG